jgi:hypothetical protein
MACYCGFPISSPQKFPCGTIYVCDLCAAHLTQDQAEWIRGKKIYFGKHNKQVEPSTSRERFIRLSQIRIKESKMPIPFHEAIPSHKINLLYTIKCSSGDCSSLLLDFLPNCLIQLVSDYAERCIQIKAAYSSNTSYLWGERFKEFSFVLTGENENLGVEIVEEGDECSWSWIHREELIENFGRHRRTRTNKHGFALNKEGFKTIGKSFTKKRTVADLVVIHCMISILQTLPKTAWCYRSKRR